MDIRAITLGIASNGTVTLVASSGESKAQVASVQNSTTLGNTYASCEVWDRSLGLICKRVFGDPSVKGANVTIQPQAVTMQYGDESPTFELEAVGLFPNDNVASCFTNISFAVKTSQGEAVADVSSADAGTYKIIAIATLVAGKQYDVIKTDGVLTIAKKSLTITADNKTMTAGGEAPTYSATAEGLVEGDSLGTLTYTIKDSEGNTVADVTAAEAGEYDIVVSGFSDTTNYDPSYVAGKLTIEAGS